MGEPKSNKQAYNDEARLWQCMLKVITIIILCLQKHSVRFCRLREKITRNC